MIQKNKQTKNKKFRSCRRGDCYVREFFISCVTAPIAVHSVFAMLLLQICFQIVQHYLIAIGIHVYSFYLYTLFSIFPVHLSISYLLIFFDRPLIPPFDPDLVPVEFQREPYIIGHRRIDLHILRVLCREYKFYLWVKDPPEFFLDPVGIRSCFISFHLADLLSGSPFHTAPGSNLPSAPRSTAVPP